MSRSPCQNRRSIRPGSPVAPTVMTRWAMVAVATAGFAAPQAAAQEPEETADPVAALVARLTLDNYKATLKGLTRFGDRRQGT